MTKNIPLSASILAADFADLGQESQVVIDAGVDFIHFDVMDHHFVPNLSFGAFVCRALRHFCITAPIYEELELRPQKAVEMSLLKGQDVLLQSQKARLNKHKTPWSRFNPCE